ncbi:MAG: response regulator [Polyangiaceae bacterium]|jgi:DNA-binding NtrC family response regulator|nr:response regulator [Polyangiaceae bacterium]
MGTRAVTNARPRGGGARILLADDDDATRRALCCALRYDGHRVVMAKDGQELLNLVAHDLLSPRHPSEFDLIVTDVVMPGVSGLDVLEGLHAAGSATPFIVITAFGSPEIEEAARRDGAMFFIEKPFELDQFREAVARSLEPHEGVVSDEVPHA